MAQFTLNTLIFQGFDFEFIPLFFLPFSHISLSPKLEFNFSLYGTFNTSRSLHHNVLFLLLTFFSIFFRGVGLVPFCVILLLFVSSISFSIPHFSHFLLCNCSICVLKSSSMLKGERYFDKLET